MNLYITKSLYLEYLDCPKNAWLKLHKFGELYAYFRKTEDEKYRERQGAWTEHYARKLFPGGVEVEQRNDNVVSSALSAEHIHNKTPVIFQPTFVYDVFLARSDILEYDVDYDAWNVYEVKSTTSVKYNHMKDVAFQYIILRACGINVRNIYIMHISKNCISCDPVDVNTLFVTRDVTDDVLSCYHAVWQDMTHAKDVLCHQSEHEVPCTCLYKGRSSHCKTFTYSHPYVPRYSVHDIHRIGQTKKKLHELVDSGVLCIDHVPESCRIMQDEKPLACKQQHQIRAYKEQTPYIDVTSIRNELQSLQYPLYFLDYEAYNPAIPIFSGYAPYEYVTFQLSLHVLSDSHHTPEHHEYLCEHYTDPSWSIVQQLYSLIGSTGTVVVWHKDFESKRHEELAQWYPEYASFLCGLNNRMYDLEDIFKNQLYVHPDFKGSSSLKNVLPVVCPEVSYDNLQIQDGSTASYAWYNMICSESTQHKREVAEWLKRYCELDTYAMYAIWRHLRNL